MSTWGWCLGQKFLNIVYSRGGEHERWVKENLEKVFHISCPSNYYLPALGAKQRIQPWPDDVKMKETMTTLCSGGFLGFDVPAGLADLVTIDAMEDSHGRHHLIQTNLKNDFYRRWKNRGSKDFYAQKLSRQSTQYIRPYCVNHFATYSTKARISFPRHVHKSNFSNYIQKVQKFSHCPENFQTLWKLSRLSRNCPDCPEIIQNVWKPTSLSGNFPPCLGNFPDCLEPF